MHAMPGFVNTFGALATIHAMHRAKQNARRDRDRALDADTYSLLAGIAQRRARLERMVDMLAKLDR